MPVILPAEAWPAWLDTENTAPEAHLALLRPYEGALVASPVDPWVNKVGNEGPRCQAPPGAPEETE
jgi:putative SOS response-associated peptidase YedK